MIKFVLEKNKIRVITNFLSEIREIFSVKDENASFKKKFGPQKHLQTRLYCITPTGLFDQGMFYDIYSFVTINYPNEDIEIDDRVYEIVKPTINGTVINNLNLPLRDYQNEACLQCLKFGRGILKMGTGAGKTLTICTLLASFYEIKKDFKGLLIVPDLSLVNQTYSDFKDYNAPFNYTRWTGKLQPDLTSNIIIANLGILQSQFEENNWIKTVDILVIDECHKLRKGNKVNKIIQNIQTNHKFGLTGTLPEEKIDEWNIKGKIGPVIYSKDSYSLRIEEYLTNVLVNIINVKYKSKPVYRSGENNFKHELDFLYNNSFRNNLIYSICSKFDKNILILVNHLDHGDLLYNVLLKNNNKEVYYIKGEVDVEERDRIKKIMETNHNVVCIAVSAIFSTGINIKNIHMILFVAGGKSFIRTIQSIGRGLRKHDEKRKLQIIDIGDQTKYGKEHLNKRKQIYSKEKIQFVENNILEVD